MKDDRLLLNDSRNDKTMTRSTKCRSWILASARRSNKAFQYDDLLEDPTSAYAYGTLRNVVSGLVKAGELLKFPGECPTRFILREWANRSEYSRWFNHDTYPMGSGCHRRSEVSFDFVGFVASLDFEEVVHVHDVRLEFDAVRFAGVGSDGGWVWLKRSRSWMRRFVDLEFPVVVQVYDTGRVQVAVKCSLKPISLKFNGLMRLTSVLGEVKGRLNWSGVPNVADWVVTCWHYGRDSKGEVSGAPFETTFRTWSKILCRIYWKSELKKVRVEEVQSPRRSVQEVFDDVVAGDGRASSEKGGVREDE